MAVLKLMQLVNAPGLGRDIMISLESPSICRVGRILLSCVILGLVTKPGSNIHAHMHTQKLVNSSWLRAHKLGSAAVCKNNHVATGRTATHLLLL